MASLEFDLVLETNRTNWREPNLPWGGIPNITAQDVQQAYARIRHPYGAHAIKAKYAQLERSLYNLAEYMRALSWDLWEAHTHLHRTQITVEQVHRVGELAVVFFIWPQSSGRAIDANAEYCHCGSRAWKAYLQQHHIILWGRLIELESDGLNSMLEFLRARAA